MEHRDRWWWETIGRPLANGFLVALGVWMVVMGTLTACGLTADDVRTMIRAHVRQCEQQLQQSPDEKGR